MAVLTIRDLSVHGWGGQLLHHISVDVKAGELLAIIGPNGAGKTTLMNSIVNTHQHQLVGDIDVCGQAASVWQSEARARHIAFLPQASVLSFPFTVEEVVSLSRTPHNTGVQLDRQIIHEALQALDINHLKQRLYTQLSGGEKQRVQLARVMAQIWRSDDAEQRLLLLDEPTSSLDLGHQEQLMDAVRLFANQGVATVMIVHDVNLAMRHADTVLALRDGKVIAQGQPSDVVNSALMKTLYNVNVTTIRHPETHKMILV
jgi:iron complex transport system ATP-binding protein